MRQFTITGKYKYTLKWANWSGEMMTVVIEPNGAPDYIEVKVKKQPKPIRNSYVVASGNMEAMDEGVYLVADQFVVLAGPTPEDIIDNMNYEE